MKVTILRTVTLTGLLLSSLLLVFAANCSFEEMPEGVEVTKPAEPVTVAEQTDSLPGSDHAEPGPGEQEDKSNPSEQQTEETKPSQHEEEVVVANQFCAACHYGFDEEELALNHKLAGVGCERCHGESARHRSDERNITPPEIMWAKAKINPMCMMCHPRHEIKRVTRHERFLAGAETIFDPEIDHGSSSASAARQHHCTDCHGRHHRVNVRGIRWNRATGELLTE